jgi:hypothetical protein
MRIDEITINIPIKIDLDGDKPRVNVAGKDADEPEVDDRETDHNPVMINPLQQELELKKSEQGKDSPVIDKLLDPEEHGGEDEPLERELDRPIHLDNLKTLAGLKR